jgi:hypothetical protein
MTRITSRLSSQLLHENDIMAHPSRKTDTRSTRSTHHFVDESKADAIHRWNEQVPTKLTDDRGSKGLSDPSIQAYIEAKMALLRSSTPTTG